MQKYQELCQNLQKQTVLHGDSDGFYSGELRNMILRPFVWLGSAAA